MEKKIQQKMECNKNAIDGFPLRIPANTQFIYNPQNFNELQLLLHPWFFRNRCCEWQLPLPGGEL